MNDKKEEVPDKGEAKKKQDPDYLPFAEARAFVRNLGLKNKNEWTAWARSDQRPANIPRWPENVYAEYTDLTDWLGKAKPSYRSFEEARAFAQSLDLPERT